MMGKAQGLLARSVTRVLPRFLRRSSGKSLASFVCLSFVVASVGLLPACGTGKPSAPPSSTSSSSSAASPNPSASPSSSEDSGIIRAYGTAPVDPLTPGKAQDNASGRLVDLVFAGLVAWDSNGDTHYAAASDIEPNDDFTQFQVTVRSDLGFSDGTEVTAQSFIKAWDYVANIRHKQPNAPYLALIKGYGDLRRKDVTENAHMDGLTQTGEYSFTIELSQPCLNFMSLLANRAFDPLPEAFYANPSKFEANPIGNGPYRVSSYQPGKSITLLPNLNYKGAGGAANDGLRFVFYSDPAKAYDDLVKGRLDVTEVVPSARLGFFTSSGKSLPAGLKATNSSGNSLMMLTTSKGYPHFALNQEGALRRKALSRAINRSDLAKETMKNLGLPATDFLNPAVSAYTDSLNGSEVLTYNAQAAKDLWEQANSLSPWKPGDSLDLTYDAQAEDPAFYRSLAESLKKVLKIKVRLRPVSTTYEFGLKMKQGKLRGLIGFTWRPSGLVAWNYLMPLYTNQLAGSGLNASGYQEGDFSTMLSKALVAATASSSISLYQSAEEILLQQLPGIPLVYKNSFGLSSTTVSGFALNSNGLPRYPSIRRIQ